MLKLDLKFGSRQKFAKLHLKSRIIFRYDSKIGITNTKKPNSRGCYSNIKANVPFFSCLFFIGSNLLQRFPKILHLGCVPEACLLPEMIVAPESFAHSRKSAPEISSYRFHVCSMIFVPVQSFSDQPSITARPCCCTCCRSPVAKPWVLHAMAAGALDLVLK